MPESALKLVDKIAQKGSDDISLFRGGLSYRAQVVTHLIQLISSLLPQPGWTIQP